MAGVSSTCCLGFLDRESSWQGTGLCREGSDFRRPLRRDVSGAPIVPRQPSQSSITGHGHGSHSEGFSPGDVGLFVLVISFQV